jgi:hypothetical protein
LIRVREDVLAYLAFVTHDIVQSDSDGALREIQRFADRPTRITAMTPPAIEAALKSVRAPNN